MATIQFLGATGTVTGSKFVLEVGGSRAMIDCGLFQGHKELRMRNWQPLPINPASIGWVILTHAHIDHTLHEIDGGSGRNITSRFGQAAGRRRRIR
jgi:metallo-beta-lactamase family protein